MPGGPCLINADAGQFETALINMAVNARDAMGGEGRLTIAVRNVADIPGPAPHPNRADGYVAVSVEDTGSGIPQDQLGRIFEPFFTTKEVGQGTGLGLSQVFGFAKQSGGEVMVDSKIGKGKEVRQIAKRLHLSPKTVETHRAHIKEKLNLQNARQVARFAVQWVGTRNV